MALYEVKDVVINSADHWTIITDLIKLFKGEVF